MQELRNIFGGFGNRLFQLAYIYAQVREGNLPDIYLQDFKYFEKYKEEIKSLFAQGGHLREERIAIHIRRGDYQKTNFYVDLTKTDYYDKAIALFPKDKFLLFCADRQPISNDFEDAQWAWNYLKGKGIEERLAIYSGKDEIDDFNAMAACKGIICANSSFSTWAAFVNQNPDKKIVAPKEYYSDKVERTVLPKNEGWIYV